MMTMGFAHFEVERMMIAGINTKTVWFFGLKSRLSL
jgi:hypothetical protein